MTEKKDIACLQWNKSAVKDIILEFETKTGHCETKIMGAEQSARSRFERNSKSSTIGGNSIVKQRVKHFDNAFDENRFDKKKRHKSVIVQNKNDNGTVREFQRSKSFDVLNKNEPFKFNNKNKTLGKNRAKTFQDAPMTTNSRANYSPINTKKLISNFEKRAESCNNLNRGYLQRNNSNPVFNSVNQTNDYSSKIEPKTIQSDLNLENYRKGLKNEIEDCSDSSLLAGYNNEDLNQIENSLQEIERTIKEISRNTKLKQENDNHSNEELENIDIYLQNDSIHKDEDEFGERTFCSFESINFTEAYNRAGDELIITSVAAVERRSLEDSKTPQNDEPIFTIKDTVTNEEQKFKNNSEEFRVSYNSEISDISTLNSSNSGSVWSIDKPDLDPHQNELPNKQSLKEIAFLQNNVEIRKFSSNGCDRTIKTETIYDDNQNPRIENISSVNSQISDEMPELSEKVSDSIDTLKISNEGKQKKDYIIEELVETEKKYIQHLKIVVREYMPAAADELLPPSLKGKSCYLFGNIKKIYITTQKFYRALKNCGNNHEAIAQTFMAFKDLFELYPLYSKNKPKSDQLLSDFKDIIESKEKELNDRLGLASSLLTPIQRLGKYILFLEQIQKDLSKTEGHTSENISKAIQTVREQMSKGNDYIAIDSIKESVVNLFEQGSFVMREKFNVIKPRKYESMLFLFEKMLVLTTVDMKNPESFIYKDSISLNEMGIVVFDDQPLVFHLKRFPSNKKDPKEYHEFVIEAKKGKDKKTWTEEIKKRLWEQLVKCKEEQHVLKNTQNGHHLLPGEMKKMLL